MKVRQWVKNGLWLAVILSLVGCATARVYQGHPQLVKEKITAEKKAEVATVYFIRPTAYKSKGVANDPVRIEFQGQTLLRQDEGSYTLLYLKQSKGTLKVHSKTLFTDKRDPVDVWRSREYKFIVGKTYFIYIRQINEEFRGVFYEPEPISLREAKALIKIGKGRFSSTRASGLAGSAPIEGIESVNVPPASAIKGLAPSLPENIYKQEKYLRKVR
ncbi:MAG: hypothetical protein COB30_020365 [Ectothiorhodospiraceae bacterium]|nr:hypothetical protein [Ectothiorhodospiraceae bacterium]